MIGHAVSLAAAVALLLWAIRLIRTGIERGFLVELRTTLRSLAGRPVTAVAGGAAAAMLLQSSTAVALIGGGLAAGGLAAPETALVLLLGADLGSAVMAQVFSLPVEAVLPFILLSGVVLFLNARRRRSKQIGRILVGIALVLVALGMIRAAAQPIAGSALLQGIAEYLAGDLPSAFVIGALTGWVLHSGLAAVLTFASFAASGLVPPAAGAALVIGANLGAALVPVTLLSRAPRPARIVAQSNLLARGGAALAALGWLAFDPALPARLADAPAQQLLFVHIGLNALVVLLAAPLAARLVRIAGAIFPDRAIPEPAGVSALDPDAFGTPRVALSCAQREVLRMAEEVHAMLVVIMRLYRDWEVETAEAIARREDIVDRMHFDVKLYIARLRESALSERDDARCLDIVAMANSIEDAGDRISTGLVQQARKLRTGGLAFSSAGLSDIERFHQQVVANSQLALNVLTTGDAEDARQLVAEKDRIRSEEQKLQERHLSRLGDGEGPSLETTNIHQEVLRILKQVNAALSFVAYPIAEETGDLLASRLAEPRVAREGG